jgi:hypothetical protein
MPLLPFYYHPCFYSATALRTTSSAILLDLSLPFSKLFVHSLWPSLIEFKSSFSPSHTKSFLLVIKLYQIPLASQIFFLLPLPDS